MRPSKAKHCRKPPPRKLNAAHAIVVVPVQLALLVPMDTMVSTDSKANLVIVVQQPPVALLIKDPVKLNANALLQLAIPVPLDQKDPTDPPAMLVLLALMVNPAALVPLAQQALLAHLVTMVLLAQLAMPAILPAQPLAPLATPVQLDTPVLLALLVNPVVPAKMAVPAQLVPLAMLVLLALLDMLVAPVPQATPARTVHQAVANTAHQLVWLQVSKHPTHFGGNTEYGQQMVSKKMDLSTTNFLSFSFFILACSCASFWKS